MSKEKLDAEALWSDLEAVRERAPLVHSITNLVVMNFNANALLAVGASPVMAHAHEEVREMVGIADALVLNIGTLEPDWIRAMQLALRSALTRAIPVVLDPVGAGATPYRDQALVELLETGSPTVLRGNASEILSMGGLAGGTRGVDSSAVSDAAVFAARGLARELGCVVCISGADDHIVDAGGRHVTLSNGHPWMTRVTGVGCSASALIGAFAAVQPDPWRATVAAMACLGVVGELAVERTQAAGAGVGRLQIKLLDGLQLLDREAFAERLTMIEHA
ncbi:hydroxyethylthiazole kinase [Rhodocyclus purpureus]|uniref:hydroxyethylthiazole kinase n=1 Tax=Rhodocyclus purpureus TaxID=1067 RepID=UPI0019143C9C|nr:hydroxyethylthiazole kinase [Rhodocyclus purpureus]MBK5914235.1 hydroxyethylthiazole kinase [Rhodocyclus purpureus]